jgi:DNA gyrase inhibitor GyrI
MTDSDTDYYLKRAEQEEVLAIQADHPKAAAAHRDLSVRYSACAVIAIVNDQDEPRDKARHRGLIATMRAVQMP